MPECRIGWLKIHVEVPLMLLFFAFMLSDAVFTNLVIYRTCYVTLGYNKSECALLGSENKDNNTQHLEQLVEPYAATINMVRSFIEGLGGAFVCLFIGPWSDKFGRTPVMLLCTTCYTVQFLIVFTLSLFPNASPWYFLLVTLPVFVSGGFATFFTSMLSYIADITTEANRGVRMGVFEAVLTIGMLLGNLTSPYLFYATNYSVVFGVTSGCCLLGTAFTYYFIPESRPVAESEGSFKEVFRITHVKDMWRTTTKRRENHARGIILTCILCLSFYITVINGSTAVFFLFLREKFQWSLKKFTMFNCISSVVYATGSVFGGYVLHKFLGITESVLILIGYISILNCTLLQGFAQKDWHLYFGTAVHGLSGVISPLSRTLVSKCISPEEVGKLYSFIIISESLLGMIGSPLYTEIYNATITTDPGVFNFVSSGFYTSNCLLTLLIIWWEVQKSYSFPYIEVGDDGDKDCNANPAAMVQE